ncbi:ATP-binding cassette domain-containing protein [Chelativorans sp. Marseille-P2723]|uniref:ATP-binding cassette domain-containing protein n=1 Tax=Chelativorans sp. Marseille-P2723 TaxID=2709133 RepID=UPI00157120BC|nr:ATP-binding cassette domain-containing protein [Chelativorans sp. Marseille-P2723]
MATSPALKQRPQDHASLPPLAALTRIAKTYGDTHANSDVNFDIAAGEVVGLVGANGAGKSTLMRILCGVTEPNSGAMRFDGQEIDLAVYSPQQARERGIRIVWQELSLSPNLSVAENFYVEQPQFVRRSAFWLRDYHRLANEAIERIFPGAAISTRRLVSDMTIAERQMVEISRAACDPRLKLLILDEPTSSLGAERSRQLRDFVRALAGEGKAVIFISHKLSEVLSLCDRVVAMRNGRIAWEKPANEANIDDLVNAMGGAGVGQRAARRDSRLEAAGAVQVRIDGPWLAGDQRPVELRAGEVIGLAGLEGSGQKRLLQALFAKKHGDGLERHGPVRYVSGDRQLEGVFPLWTVLDNVLIGRVAQWAGWRPVNVQKNRPAVEKAAQRLSLDPGRLDSNILELSGGNQQKALVARALIDEAGIILLDDPTRGVDIAAKRDFYRVVREIAAAGRLVIWLSTEDLEFLECDRVLVFSGGKIVTELRGEAISEEAIVASSFAKPEKSAQSAPAREDRSLLTMLLKSIPFVSLVLVFAAMTYQNPLVASGFGLQLLLTPAVTLVLIAVAQMFIVGGSEIDLGVGNFCGLVNVVSATILFTAPFTGGAILIGLIAAYALMGLLIQARAIPAIVVTLGASFVWAGLGQTIQPSPGGASPEWLRAMFSFKVPGIPTPLLLIFLVGLAAYSIDRSPAGTILRAFGSNVLALRRAGWSHNRYSVLRYGIASIFVMIAGLYVTATNGASDINAGTSYTLLGIAAVVIGGCQLLGGVIAPLGVVAGAVTLALIGALLASLGVSTDYNAAVQGTLLILILALQALAGWRRSRG